MKEIIISLFSGLIGVVLTIGYQHFIAPDPTIIVKIGDKEMEVTSTNYEELSVENELLKNKIDSLTQQNEKYINDLLEANNKLEELQAQTRDLPIINYSNLALSIDGDNIPINMNNSMLNIDGREFISKEIVEKIIPDNEIYTIKDDTLFIGKVIREKSSLMDEVVVDSGNILKTNIINDSYGNTHTNALCPQNYHSYMIVNLNRQFSLFKLKLAVQENGHSDAIVTIIADDIIVYTSPSLTITTEPFDVIDIPINNCSLLTIKIDSGADNGMGKGFGCLISDPVVYN